MRYVMSGLTLVIFGAGTWTVYFTGRLEIAVNTVVVTALTVIAAWMPGWSGVVAAGLAALYGVLWGCWEATQVRVVKAGAHRRTG